ncbi:MAG: SPOR domain-containing protein, partial [bacterium]
VKAGSFFSEIDKSYLDKITHNGFPYVIQRVQQGDKIIRRVFIGPFNSIQEATQSLNTIRTNINEFAYIQTNIVQP